MANDQCLLSLFLTSFIISKINLSFQTGKESVTDAFYNDNDEKDTSQSMADNIQQSPNLKMPVESYEN